MGRIEKRRSAAHPIAEGIARNARAHLTIIAAMLAVTLLAVAMDAQESSSSANPIVPFRSFLVGVWEPVRDPGKPDRYSEMIRFAPILDGRFVTWQQIIHDSAGKLIYRDFVVFGVDPDTQMLFLHAYNSDGSIDRTDQVVSPAGSWAFVGTVYGSEKFRDYRYTLFRLDDTHLRVLIELLKAGKYETFSDRQYVRQATEISREIE